MGSAPVTRKLDPFGTILPAVVNPSPQVIVAENLAAVSAGFAEVKKPTVPAYAAPSTAKIGTATPEIGASAMFAWLVTTVASAPLWLIETVTE